MSSSWHEDADRQAEVLERWVHDVECFLGRCWRWLGRGYW